MIRMIRKKIRRQRKISNNAILFQSFVYTSILHKNIKDISSNFKSIKFISLFLS